MTKNYDEKQGEYCEERNHERTTKDLLGDWDRTEGTSRIMGLEEKQGGVQRD